MKVYFTVVYFIPSKIDAISDGIAAVSNRIDKMNQANTIASLQSVYQAAVRFAKNAISGGLVRPEQQKHLFAGARPEAILVDMIPALGLKETVDGLPVRMAQDVLGKEEAILPIVLFSRTVHTAYIMEKIATLYSQYFEQLVVAPPLNKNFLHDVCVYTVINGEINAKPDIVH